MRRPRAVGAPEEHRRLAGLRRLELGIAQLQQLGEMQQAEGALKSVLASGLPIVAECASALP